MPAGAPHGARPARRAGRQHVHHEELWRYDVAESRGVKHQAVVHGWGGPDRRIGDNRGGERSDARGGAAAILIGLECVCQFRQ